MPAGDLEPDAVERLAGLQRRIVDAAVPLVRPGGTFVYSVCTLTAAETLAVDHHLATRHPDLEPLDPPATPGSRTVVVRSSCLRPPTPTA
jgi:16S rRNA (cytosine967-C5)-methyltransferase